MQCHYGCCTYEEKPYPTGMVINRYHEPTAEDDRTLIPNVRYRVPVIQVPEITSTTVREEREYGPTPEKRQKLK